MYGYLIYVDLLMKQFRFGSVPLVSF